MTRKVLAGLTAALGLLLAFYLLRDAAAIFVAAPLDPNEGWNAMFAMRAANGGALYPAGMLVNNYPPLSFYAVGALGRLTGDFIFAGRLISLIAFLSAACGIAAVSRHMGCGRLEAAFAALFFAAALLLGSNYVAMDDPQLFGHALQLGALWLLWRKAPMPVLSASIFVLGLFVKHNLIALPLAAAAFLVLEDCRAARRFVLAGLCTGFAGLGAFGLLTGQNLLGFLASPRGTSFENLAATLLGFLRWALLPLIGVLAFLIPAWDRKPARFVLLYLACALGAGTLFAPGNGVDANIFFDAAIALALAGAVVLQGLAGWRAPALAAAMIAPLIVFAALDFEDADFPYTPVFRWEAAHDIAFLKTHPGPALCEMASLCGWAGKPASVDVFNLGQAFATGARDDAGLARLIAARRFAVLQFDALVPFALGAHVKTAVDRGYRLDHEDDNGVFFVPR